MSTNDKKYLSAFEVIVNFIDDLCEFFGDKHKPLKLYKRLLEHVTLSDKKYITKHLDVFRTFCQNNRIAIQTKDKDLFKENGSSQIKFSDKVFIDMDVILNLSPDEVTTDAIWKHLLTISVYLDPDSNAKEILKADKAKDVLKDNNGMESNFLTDIISKVESSIEPGTNPQDAMSSILSSGVFSDVVKNMSSSIQEGKLDIGKLLGTVTQMCGALNENSDMPMDLGPITGILSSLSGESKVSEIEDEEK